MEEVQTNVSYIWGHPGLTAEQRLVAVNLALRTQERTGISFLPVDELTRRVAADCVATEADVDTVINELVAMGIVYYVMFETSGACLFMANGRSLEKTIAD